MSKRFLKYLIVFILVVGVIVAGAWAYLNVFAKKNTPTATSSTSQSTLSQLVAQSSIVVIGKMRDAGANQVITGGTNTYGDTTATTLYAVDVVSLKHPSDGTTLKPFGLVMPGGTDANGKSYTVSGVPKLNKGDEYLIFAKLGADGFFRPVSNGLAVAQKSGDVYTFSGDILKGSNSFSVADLDAAVAGK